MYNKRKINRIRKRHHCEGCHKVFEIGCPMVYITAVFDGDFQYYYLCLICHDFIKAFPRAVKDGWEPGGLNQQEYSFSDASKAFWEEAKTRRKQPWYRVVPFKRWRKVNGVYEEAVLKERG